MNIQSCCCTGIIAGIDQEPIEGIGVYRIVIPVILDEKRNIRMQHILQDSITAYMLANLVQGNLAHGHVGLFFFHGVFHGCTGLRVVILEVPDIIKFMADTAAEIAGENLSQDFIQICQIIYIFQIDQGYDMAVIDKSLGIKL